MNIDFLLDRETVIKNAEQALRTAPLHVTDQICPLSQGNKHCYVSFGDYWWPDETQPNGLPYLRKDGESNPNNFDFHRKALRTMRTAVSHLAIAYRLTRDERYAAHAVRMLKEFFLDEETYMEPHLLYAQGIPGICTGRGIGIIDTLHLTELPFAIEALTPSPSVTNEILVGLKTWFCDYLDWMNTHPYGIEERDHPNNHGICWHVQALSFARFTDRTDIIKECVHRYKTVILPSQMRQDGALPMELARTKPYGYSIFALDNLVSMVHLASLCGEDLWNYSLSDGRSIKKGLDFLFPYLQNKSLWFLPPDIEHFDAWPARSSFLVFAGAHYHDDRYLRLYLSLPAKTDDEEVRRNLAIREPLLMI